MPIISIEKFKAKVQLMSSGIFRFRSLDLKRSNQSKLQPLKS